MTDTGFLTLTIDCPAGDVVARMDGDVIRATGIPYASADRFEVPVPEPSSAEPIDATSWSPACPQNETEDLLRSRFGDAALGDVPEDEQCHRLSVTVPADREPGESLPVMVWIHGGSYVLGAADAPCHDPANLVAEQRVVVVSITYRLGLFGFVGDDVDRPANLGLLDMIEALRWVRRNVAAFGGDPDAVTVFGESAGADAAAHLMIADGTEGLFRRVIMQSAPLGLARGRAGLSAAMVDATRQIDTTTPIDDVLAAQSALARNPALLRYGLGALMAFGTQYGHAPLPAEDEVDAAWEQRAADVEVLIGWNEREAAFFTAGISVLGGLQKIPVAGPALYELIVRGATKAVYTSAAKDFIRRHRRVGGLAAQYVLEWGVPGDPLRAAHTVDIPLLFGDQSTWDGAPVLVGHRWSEVEANGRRLRAIWADFARAGWTSPADVPGLIRFGRE
ncbi:carboxylesterase family protein [Gordonia sp. SL306]|uniref:carboxylesterase family protein n=1 Tax=Gordonia sp. SL306 TaxID=2995145 RepID=UPI00226EEF1E|nr:carboxylesterase family protein [Gordonia sp. SL306]WAC57743.1 carboxylesterase family protein [Gordonia sp. SL306]